MDVLNVNSGVYEDVSAHLHADQQSKLQNEVKPATYILLHPAPALLPRPRGARIRMRPVISSTDHLGGPLAGRLSGSPRCAADLFPPNLSTHLLEVNQAELPLLVLLAGETWAGCSLWSEFRQEDVPGGKFISVEKQLCHAAAGGECADSDVVKPNKFICEWRFYWVYFHLGLIFIVFTVSRWVWGFFGLYNMHVTTLSEAKIVSSNYLFCLIIQIPKVLHLQQEESKRINIHILKSWN